MPFSFSLLCVVVKLLWSATTVHREGCRLVQVVREVGEMWVP